jgi:magnesium-transporting ATPase (P-type)
VVSDDNFVSILNAVEEGRRIFDNAQKFMLHVLSANVGFVTTLLVGCAYKDSTGVSIFQITPVEILFMLLVASAFSETGLGFEAASKHVLNRPPQSLRHGVFTPEFVADLVAYGVIMAVCLLSSFITVISASTVVTLGRIVTCATLRLARASSAPGRRATLP